MKHESQNPQNYVNAVKLWNGFRSAQCNGKLGTYAEAYSFDPSFPFSDIELETNDIFSLSIAISPIYGIFPEPSTLRPFLMTRSCIL